MPEPRTNNNLIIHRLIPLEPFGTLIRVRDFIVEMSEGKFGLGGGEDAPAPSVIISR